MRQLVTVALILVSIIHLMPLAGLFGASKLNELYGVTFSDPNIVILMRHRAVLFGLLGGFILVAAFVRLLQPIAFALAAVSVVSFLALALSVGGFNASVGKVVAADWIALALLLIGFVAFSLSRRKT